MTADPFETAASRRSAETLSDPFEAARQRRAQRAEATHRYVRDTNPDEAAEALSLSDALQVPFTFAMRNRAAMVQAVDDRDVQTYLRNSPLTSAFMSQPEQAAVTSDSVRELAEIERLIAERNAPRRSIARQVVEVPRTAAAGALSLGGGLAGLADLYEASYVIPVSRFLNERTGGGLDAFNQVGPDVINRVAEAVTPTTLLRNAGEGFENLADAVRPDDPGFVDQIGEALGQIAGAVGLSLGTSNPAPVVGLFSGLGARQQSERMRSLGIDPNENPDALIQGATVTGATEALRLGSIMRLLPASVRSRVASSVFARIAGQAGEEAAQEAVENIGQNLIAQGYDAEARLFEGVAQEATTAGTASAIFQGLVEVALPGRARQARARQEAETMTQLREAVEQVPAFQRSREAIESFLNNATEAQTVFLDDEGVTALYQTEGFDVLRSLGVTEDQVSAAFAGNDVEISASRLLTVQNRAQYDRLVEITRIDPDADTLAEAANAAFNAAREIDYSEALARLRDEEQSLEGFEIVQENVTQQLQNAGRSLEESQTAGVLWGAIFRTIEERFGVDSARTFERLGLNIQRADAQQRRADLTDLLIEDLRRDAIPSEAEAFGPTLQDYARDEGLIARRGELELDDAALDAFGERATELGFFPERPSANDIRQALEGGPVYLESNRNEPVAQRREALLSLQEQVRGSGIDLADASNDAVRSALGDVLNQEGKGDARAQVLIPGGGVLSDQDTIVRLSQAADKTSFLHETAHIYLELLAEMESENDAVAADMATIREWLGSEPGAKLTREQHETFAESFEVYLMEGKAPSTEMKGVFRKFRAWFLQVYRNLRGQLPALNDEAREIFDRMLATDDEITAARNGYALTLSSVMEGLMDSDEVGRYREDARRAGDVAFDRLLRKHIAQIQRRETRRYKDGLREVEQQVRSEIMAMPVYRAFADLTRPDGPKLDKAAIIEMRGASAPAAIPRSSRAVYAAKGGVHPDVVANDYGFTSGDEMLVALIGARKPKDAIQAEVDRLMRERFGDIRTDGTVEREALQAVHNEPQIRAMSAEADVLAKRAGRQPIPLNAIKAWADNEINTRPIRDVIQPGRYAIKARDLHKRAIRAAAREQWMDAMRYTHQAMAQHELARRAFKAREEIEKINRRVSTSRNRSVKTASKTMDPQFLRAAKNLIALYDGRAEDAKVARNDLIKWADEINAGDYPGEIGLPTSLLENDVRAMREMSFEQLRDFDRSVRNIEYVGRRNSEAELAAFKEENARFAEGILENARRKKPRARDPTGVLNAVQRFGETADAQITRWSFILEALDGFDPDGPMQREFDGELRAASSDELNRNDADAKKLRDILNEFGITQGDMNRRVHVPQLDPNNPVRMETLISLALNMGNDGNISRVLNDPTILAEDPEAIVSMLDQHLEKRHWDGVQAVWDYIDTKWPELSALEQRVKGVAPAKVEASPITTRHGTYAGGYYPIAYDRTSVQNQDIAEGTDQERYDSWKDGGSVRASTRQGHAEARLKNAGSRPLDLSLSVALQHLQQVNKDIAMRETVTRLDRRLRAPEVREAIFATQGREIYQAMQTILRRTVAGLERPATIPEKLIRRARVNWAVSILGLSVRTVLLQPTSLIQTVVPKYGLKTVRRGYAEFWLGNGVTGPAKSLSFITERSSFMRERVTTATRELYDNIKAQKIHARWGRIQAMSLKPMVMMEIMAVGGPIWMGVYRAQIEAGASERDAISAGDRAVATTQGSGLPMDQSVLQGGNEIARAFTFMWGYMSGVYGLTRSKIGDFKSTREVFPLVSAMALMYVVPGFIEALLDAPDDDDETYLDRVLKRQLSTVTGAVPGLSLVSGVWAYGSDSFALDRTFKDTGRAWESYQTIGQDLWEDGHTDGEAVRAALLRTGDALTTIIGIPGWAQFKRTYRTLTEDDDPTLYEALVSGPDRK